MIPETGFRPSQEALPFVSSTTRSMQEHCGTCCFSTILTAITFSVAQTKAATKLKIGLGLRWVTHSPCLRPRSSLGERKRGPSLSRFAILGAAKGTKDHGVTIANSGTMNQKRKCSWSSIDLTASSGSILTPTWSTFGARISATTHMAGPSQSS